MNFELISEYCGEQQSRDCHWEKKIQTFHCSVFILGCMFGFMDSNLR